jgi:hypothetical protein
MIRTLTVIIGLALSLVAARDASAGRIAATDFDSLAAGSYVHRSFDWFVAVRTDVDPAHRQGILWSDVTFDGALYTYAHEVTPYLDDNNQFATLFGVNHFSGIAGWSFSDALRAGGTGTASDFVLEGVGDRLRWSSQFPATPGGSGWNAFEPITFFFVSTRPPWKWRNPFGAEAVPFGLTGGSFAGTGEGLAPVPEPVSIALFGSGLAGLYAARRRRRSHE